MIKKDSLRNRQRVTPAPFCPTNGITRMAWYASHGNKVIVFVLDPKQLVTCVWKWMLRVNIANIGRSLYADWRELRMLHSSMKFDYANTNIGHCYCTVQNVRFRPRSRVSLMTCNREVYTVYNIPTENEHILMNIFCLFYLLFLRAHFCVIGREKSRSS